MAKAAGNGYSPPPKAAAPKFYSTMNFYSERIKVFVSKGNFYTRKIDHIIL
jgi:hypothetical protein